MSIDSFTLPTMALTSEPKCCDEPYIEDGYCQECDTDLDMLDQNDRYLWNYSYKPFGTMFVDVVDDQFVWCETAKLTTEKMIYGLELEVEYRDDHNMQYVINTLTGINAAFGSTKATDPCFCIGKEDGTVDVEFVTAPFTYAAYVKALPMLEKTLTQAQEYFRAFYASSAGAHVHVNKNSLSLTTAYAWIQFHYDNPGLIADIAQRSIGMDAEWCYLQKPDIPVARIAKQKYGFPNRGALADTHATIEHRYFRSNLRPARISKNMEFLESMFTYFNTLTYQDMARDGAHKLYAYLAHVSLMRHQYPNLYDYLVRKGYISCV